MWLILGLLMLLLGLGAGVLALSARVLVWRPAIRLIAAGKEQLARAQRSLATIPTRNGHPGVGSDTNDRRSLETYGATDPRH